LSLIRGQPWTRLISVETTVTPAKTSATSRNALPSVSDTPSLLYENPCERLEKTHGRQLVRSGKSWRGRLPTAHRTLVRHVVSSAARNRLSGKRSLAALETAIPSPSRFGRGHGSAPRAMAEVRAAAHKPVRTLASVGIRHAPSRAGVALTRASGGLHCAVLGVATWSRTRSSPRSASV